MMKLISNRNDVKMIEWNFKTNQNCMYNYYNSELNLINIFAQVCVFVAPFQCSKMCQIQNMHKRMNLNIHSRTVRQSNHEPWLLHFNKTEQPREVVEKLSTCFYIYMVNHWIRCFLCPSVMITAQISISTTRKKNTAAAEAVNHIKAQI